MLRVYGVAGKLLKAVQSFYVYTVGHVSGNEWIRVSGFQLLLDLGSVV